MKRIFAYFAIFFLIPTCASLPGLESLWHDYHWYRQNPDGTWSHKPSNGEVRDFDFDGNPILDPEFCNRKSNPLIDKEKQGIFKYNYSSLTYYFEVDGFYLGV